MYIYTLNNVKNLDVLAFEQLLRATHKAFIKTIVTFPIANSVCYSNLLNSKLG